MKQIEFKKIYYTLLAIILFLLGQYIPNPLIFQYVKDFFSPNILVIIKLHPTLLEACLEFSIFNSGIFPIIASYFIIKLYDKIRNPGIITPKARNFSNKIIILTFIIFLIQSIHKMMELPSPYYTFKISIDSLSFIIMSIIWIGGGFFIIYLALLINRKGIGNGFAILFCLEISHEILLGDGFNNLLYRSFYEMEILTILLVLGFIISFIMVFLKNIKINVYKDTHQNVNSFPILDLSNAKELMLILFFFNIAVLILQIPGQIFSVLPINISETMRIILDFFYGGGCFTIFFSILFGFFVFKYIINYKLTIIGLSYFKRLLILASTIILIFSLLVFLPHFSLLLLKRVFHLSLYFSVTDSFSFLFAVLALSGLAIYLREEIKKEISRR